VGALRKQWLIGTFKSPIHDAEGTYWGIGSDVANYEVDGATGYRGESLEKLREVRTDLDTFQEGEIACLENHGYALASVATSRWTKDLLPDPMPEFRWPHEDYASEDSVIAASPSKQKFPLIFSFA
jgi:NTE family protein